MKYFASSFHYSRSRSVQNGPCSSFWGLSLLSARVASLELSLETSWGWDHCKAHGYQGPHLHQNPQGQANWISQKLLGILISSHPDCLVSNGLCILPLTKLLSQVHPLGKQFHPLLEWNSCHVREMPQAHHSSPWWETGGLHASLSYKLWTLNFPFY